MHPSIDRRRLLLFGGLAVVAYAQQSALALGAPLNKRKIKKAVKLGMVGIDGSLRDKFQLLIDLGFEGVELDSPNAFELEEVLAARDATGLEIHGVVDSVHWAKPLSSPDEAVRAEGRKALEGALRDAKAYGASSVLLVPAIVSREVSYAAAWERSTAEIKRMLPLAEELNVSIAIENVWNGFLLSPLEAVRYVDQFESKHIGWYLDIGNLVNFGWPAHWVEALGHRVLKLDVKGYSRKLRDEEGLWKGFGAEIGEGDADWPAVMAALDQVGYAGWATAEVSGGDRERLTDIARRMDQVLY